MMPSARMEARSSIADRPVLTRESSVINNPLSIDSLASNRELDVFRLWKTRKTVADGDKYEDETGMSHF